MRKVKVWLWITMAIACCTGIASAGEMADSTGHVRAKKALVIPDQVENFKQEITNQILQTTVQGTGIPLGYTEVALSAGPHRGASPSYTDVAYGYSVIQDAPCGEDCPSGYSLDASLCGGNLSHRIIEVRAAYNYFIYGSVDSVKGYFTCEPFGTVTKLVKSGSLAVSASIGQAQIDQYKITGTLGVSTTGTSAICREYGYTDFVPGTVTSWYKGQGCPGGYVTHYNGAWYANSACYNNVLTGMQCYKL